LPATIAALRAHVFNGVIWPDFSRLPSREQPVLQFETFAIGDVLRLGNRRVEVLPATHTVPAVGFAVQPGEDAPAWVFTGDTGPNPSLWHRLQTLAVGQLVIEAAFGDDEHALAVLSGHLCPSLLATELQALSRPTDVYITHVKPGEVDAVMTQIAALGLPHRIHALASGHRFELR
jgi:cAMP phosphodiesterase